LVIAERCRRTSAHALGVVSLLGFIVIGFLALVRGTLSHEVTLTRPKPDEPPRGST
jgi:hypothetical protein